MTCEALMLAQAADVEISRQLWLMLKLATVEKCNAPSERTLPLAKAEAHSMCSKPNSRPACHAEEIKKALSRVRSRHVLGCATRYLDGSSRAGDFRRIRAFEGFTASAVRPVVATKYAFLVGQKDCGKDIAGFQDLGDCLLVKSGAPTSNPCHGAWRIGVDFIKLPPAVAGSYFGSGPNALIAA